MTRDPQAHLLDLSDRLYRVLLILYPASYRQEYGPLMAQAFRDLARCACTREGRLGLVVLWLWTLVDLAKTAPGEHWEAIKEQFAMSKDAVSPLPWGQGLLAVLPVFFFGAWMVSGDPRFTVGGLALSALVCAIGILIERRIPTWSLLMLGILAQMAIMWVLGLPGERFPELWGLDTLPGILVLTLPVWTLILFFLVYHRRRYGIPRLAWVLLGLIVLKDLVLSATAIGSHSPPGFSAFVPGFIVYTLGQLALTGYELLPVALGLPLARRRGLAVLLFVVGANFYFFHVIGDPTYGLWIRLDDPYQLISTFFEIFFPLFFGIIAPLWSLRARSTRWRVWGLLLPIYVALAVGAILRGALRVHASPATWAWDTLHHVGMALGLALAVVLYRQFGPEEAVPAQPEPVAQPA